MQIDFTKDIPSRKLARMARSDDYSCRLGVARHPNTSSRTLVFLWGREVRSLQQNLLQHPNLPLEMIREFWKMAPYNVLLNPSTPSNIIVTIYKNWSTNIRYLIAIGKHPNCPAKTRQGAIQELVKCLNGTEGLYFRENMPSVINEILDVPGMPAHIRVAFALDMANL